MRDDEVWPFYNFLTEEQDVYVYSARCFSPRYPPDAAEGSFDPLTESQKLDRCRPVPDLDHAVQIIRLLLVHLNRCRLIHLGGPAHLQQRSPSKRPNHRPEVP